MDRGWYFRLSLLIVTLIAAWGALWPSIEGWVPMPDIVGRAFDTRIAPGLDIQGGLRLMYEIDIDRAITHRRDRTAVALGNALAEELGIEGLDSGEASERDRAEAELARRLRVQTVGDDRIRVQFLRGSDDASHLTHDFVTEQFSNLRLADERDTEFMLQLREDSVERLRDEAVDQTRQTIEERIDTMGLANATVDARDRYLIVEVPGAAEADFDRIRAIISRTARLEFKICDDAGTAAFVEGIEVPESVTLQMRDGRRMREVEVPLKTIRRTVRAGPRNEVTIPIIVARGEHSQAALQQFVDSVEAQVPEGRQFTIGPLSPRDDPDEDRRSTDEAWQTYFLEASTDVTGEGIEDAFVTFDQNEGGRPVTIIHFTPDAAGKFGDMTGANVQKRMAIVLDDRVEDAPNINERIDGGRCQITLGTGSRNQILEDANQLVIVLKAGALPAPIEPVNEQHIGPTLGEDSIEQGITGALVGIAAVFLFMILYYQVAGIIADINAILNVFFLLAILSALGATLTLPGIAGIALTVGMAVDANVLITERIREELRLGKSPRSAVDQGFRRAFWSIVDSQLTTLIAGVVMYQFGTGPIKGFAVTLIIGILTSLYTGIFCSRIMMEWVARGLKVQRLRVG